MFYVLFFKGYDSDVAREKAIDYTTKIYAVSIREMEGTKPHQQLKEVSVEERYVTQRHSFPNVDCIFFEFPFLQLKLVFRNMTRVLKFAR